MKKLLLIVWLLISMSGQAQDLKVEYITDSLWIRSYNPEWIYDTIPVLILVNDTTHHRKWIMDPQQLSDSVWFTFKEVDMGIGDQGTFCKKGYEVLKRIKFIKTKWEHHTYLDIEKKPLVNIIVWISFRQGNILK